jgi:cellulose synthase/poly-beta-1,6-N-acetylglucosamine synthase-like glycosyltransferase
VSAGAVTPRRRLSPAAEEEYRGYVGEAVPVVRASRGFEGATDDVVVAHADDLIDAVHGMRLGDPDRSASRVLIPRQRHALIALLVVVAAGLAIAPGLVLQLLTAVVTLTYLLAMAFRVWIFRRGIGQSAMMRVSDEEARAIPDAELPVYTVLVPAYGEPEVVGELVENLAALEYPKDKLDIKLLLESDDDPTIEAALASGADDAVQVILVPPMEPRTKPKACNYGLLQARGEITTIYDAEDVPDPLQLRRVVAAFDRLDERYVCIQARLVYHNAGQNMITRWFTSEYGMWFSILLPGLVTLDAPIPLGGTSNHIRTRELVQSGGWDPYNVTEDADLGIRLYREGYRSAVLDSATLEEANSDMINWVKQRSRWLKGYLQTWLVHLRHPIALWRELGTAGFIGFNLTVGGTPLLSAANPVFWALALLWLAGHPGFVEDLFPVWTYFGATASLLIGNFCTVYMNVVGARLLGLNRLLVSCLLTPVYWVMMSMAAVKAIVQLVTNPSYWEKTAHGLDKA